MTATRIVLLTAATAFSAGAAFAGALDVQALRKDPAVQAAIAACQADATALCTGVRPGGGRILRCLVAQPEKVSPNCQGAILDAKVSLEKAGISLPKTTAK